MGNVTKNDTHKIFWLYLLFTLHLCLLCVCYIDTSFSFAIHVQPKTNHFAFYILYGEFTKKSFQQKEKDRKKEGK